MTSTCHLSFSRNKSAILFCSSCWTC